MPPQGVCFVSTGRYAAGGSVARRCEMMYNGIGRDDMRGCGARVIVDHGSAFRNLFQR